MASNSRLLNESVIRVRAGQSWPRLQLMTRDLVRRTLILLVLIGLILFLHLAEVSQVNTTSFDIQELELQYQQLQDTNRELEREIAELESPKHVLEYARRNGFQPTYNADHIVIASGRTDPVAPSTGQ